VESLTQALAEKAWQLFQTIESQGGMAQALAKGTIQSMLAKTADERARDVALGNLELTGVNSFSELGEARVKAEPHPLPEDLEDPAISIEPIPMRRLAEPFERLREASDGYLKAHKQRPKIALVTLGQASGHGARAAYAESLFATGGIETVTIDDPRSYNKSVSPIACICASDETYAREGTETAKTLHQAGADHIYLVGRPGDMRQKLNKAGVGGFIHQGCDIITTLETAHDVLGLKVRSR